MEPDPEELKKFIKIISTSSKNDTTFLLQHGVKLSDERPGTSGRRVEPEDVEEFRSVHEVKENVDYMLLQFKNKLFGDEPIDEAILKNDTIENLIKDVEKKWNPDEGTTKLPNFRDQTSLWYQSNISDPLVKQEVLGPSSHLAGLLFLEKALKENNFEPLEKKTERKSSVSPDHNEKKPCTVEELAQIFAVADEREIISTQEKTETGKSNDELIPASESNVETPSCSEVTTDMSKNKSESSKKKKKKKKDEYEPKKVEISWVDPRTDSTFEKELEELLSCDAIDLFPKVNYPPELDDLIEESIPATLPRNISEMILTASDNDFADWEYSIQLEKGEYSSEESDEEEAERRRNIIKNEIKEMGKAAQSKENLNEVTNEGYHVEGNLDVSHLMRQVLPPVVDEIIAVRDETGNITTYKTILRRDEELCREYERVQLGRESDSEDEEDVEKEEIAPEEEDKDEEILWDRPHVRGSGIHPSDLTEEELKSNLNNIKTLIDSQIDLEEHFDPKLKEQMEKVDKLLDIMRVPRATNVKVGSLDWIKQQETEAMEHITELHANKSCPAGILEGEVSSEDDLQFKNRRSMADDLRKHNKPIARPAKLNLKFNGMEGLEEAEPSPGPSNQAFQPPSFDDCCDDEYSAYFEKLEKEGIPDIFNLTDSSDEEEGEDVDSELSENEEQMMDEAFKNEYFKRGGTREGLGETEAPELDLKLDSLDDFTKKYFNFPFMCQENGSYDLVRTRRLLAQEFPEFREELFADLSKCTLQIKDSTSDSSSDSEVIIDLEPEPFELEDVAEMKPEKCPSCTGDESWLTADEDADSEFEPITLPERTLEQLLDEQQSNVSKRVKIKRKKGKKREDRNSSESEEDETKADGKNITIGWNPIDKFEKPSFEASRATLKEVNKYFVNPSPRFKRPKGMKAWLKGEYTPSKETIKKWKKIYIDHFGDFSFIDRIVDQNKQEEYEKLVEKISENLEEEPNDGNFFLNFKKVVEQRKKEKERKEKAEEMVSSQEFYQQVEVEDQGTESSNNQETTSEDKLAEDMANVKVSDTVDTFSLQTLPADKIEESDIKPPVSTIIRLRDIRPLLKKEEWAEELDCSVKRELNFNSAMKFAFELDGFQREAIQALEDGFNVFVSAHTSAGKTVVAEYAIAMSKRNRSKAVYTSPVKALSNQKYADFKKIFGSVGLITGDIQLNENAECLIMTTEILRSMLYNSSEKIRDLEFVVFDEVHYINDPERGHVWEEVLILLPSQVQIVMLSATVPNTLEFANWVGRTKQRKVMVCATHHRPVPLNHYLYTGTGGSSPGSTYLLKSGDGPFNMKEYFKSQQVMKDLQETERQNKKKQQMKRMEEEREWKRKGFPGRPPIPENEDRQSQMYKKDQTMWIALIEFLKKKDWLPAVSFVFSRKKCDTFAEMLSNVDLTSKSEKSFIHKFIKSQIEKLDEVDQDLPQIQVMKRQLDKGIGVHHSGILPVMKEIVEVLFQEGKVKLLFATETFAMGVNMPARTVVFHAVRKFDGNETRLLQPAEYVQMAGRAGRRGKDAAGNVIILTRPTDVIPKHDLEILLFGNPCKLISKFRLSYRMILNTLTVSGMLTVQNMMERSFCENHGQMKKKFVEKDLLDAEKIEKALKKSMEKAVEEMVVEILAQFYDRAIAYIEIWRNIRTSMLAHSRLIKELVPGRMIKICLGSLINRTALILENEVFPDDPSRNSYKVMVIDQNKDFERTIAPDGHEMSQDELDMWYNMVALMDELPHELEILSGPNDYSIYTVKCHHVAGIFKETIKLPKNSFEEYLAFLKKKNQQYNRNKTCDAGDKIAMFLYGYSGKYTTMDENLSNIDDFNLSCEVLNMRDTLEDLKKSNISATSPLIMKAFRRVFRWKQALRKVQLLRHDLSAENMTLYPDFRSKMDLLMEKGYISSTEQVQMKGYMAARIGKYELIVCEMLVENVLLDLSPEEVAALLSFLVYQTNTEDSPLEKILPEKLEEAIKKCKKIMLEVTELERKYDIRDYEGSEISKLKFGLVPVMYAWAKQEPLKKIMEMPVDFDFQEGMLVRWIQQLLETLKEVEAAARLMGDPGVPARLQAAGQSIKRGIVFAPSLYTTMS